MVQPITQSISEGEPSPCDDIDNPVAVAKAAGLRYVTDTSPGIRRKRVGKNFSYIGRDGSPIHDKEELRRIRSLGIPPAWTNVWICPKPNGHIQATGRDARGRKQYRYHPRWREVRDETKYNRMIEFGDVNNYLRDISGHDFTAKDFRTWAGTVFATSTLYELGAFETQVEAKKNVSQAIDKELLEQT